MDDPYLDLERRLLILAGPDKDGDEREGDGNTGIATKTRTRTKRPSLYKVLMLNDDYTPMEFVVYVLQRFFNMDQAKSVETMLTVHNKGVAVVGVYPFEVAETKVTQVMDCARSNQHPLQCTMEKE
ncbi:MAG: ATP-dependent Clp protease adapter ClpS [Pseudomonadota bacterium]